jgi:hypothetical protein
MNPNKQQREFAVARTVTSEGEDLLVIHLTWEEFEDANVTLCLAWSLQNIGTKYVAVAFDTIGMGHVRTNCQQTWDKEEIDINTLRFQMVALGA